MASSLSELLAQERCKRRQKSLKHHNHSHSHSHRSDQLVAIPLYLCRATNQSSSRHRSRPDHRSLNGSSSLFSSKRAGSVSELSNSKSSVVSEFSRRIMDNDDEDDEDNYIDEVTVRAVVAILSGYIGRYAKDEAFRGKVRGKCLSCLANHEDEDKDEDEDEDDEVVEKLEAGIASVDKLVQESGNIHKEARLKLVRHVVQILSIVVASSKNDRRSSKPRLSACAQLYLAIVYKHERNDRKSARHLLQAFCDAPSLARTELVPDLWEHFFLPHLLHLKVWYAKECECIGDAEMDDRDRKTKALLKAYNEQVDVGTIEFALYYKKLLKAGAAEGVGSPAVPVVPLPARPYRARRRSMDTCSSTNSSVNNLYHVVFGSTASRRQSSNFEERSGASSRELWGLKEEEEEKLDSYNNNGAVLHETRSRRRSSSQHERNPKSDAWREAQKPENFRFFGCQHSLPLQLECSLTGNHLIKNSSIRKKEESAVLSGHLTGAIDTISSSESLRECEFAVRVVAEAWLDSGANALLEAALSKPAVIEGMLEVLFASEEDEVLELVLSVLAELVTRNELNRLVVLNADPQLEIFRRHLRSSSLFLKAAALLYLVRPKAKQMISVEWVPLVLRVMEFGDQLQMLFAVRCSPLAAAFYLLDQLLTGFDEDRNLDNARQVVCLGGLSLLADKIGQGDAPERVRSATFLSCCVRADGSCRNYLADSLNIASLLELIVLEFQSNTGGPAFSLLIELLCLNRRTQINSILERLKEGWSGLNTMQIFFAYLRKAKPEDRPLVAATLLQLDLLGDPSKFSTYREEAIEAIIEALNCQTLDQKIQEKSARALLILGGRFSYTGEASVENWLLEKAGFRECSANSHQTLESDAEEGAVENWQAKAAAVLFRSGGERFLAVLSDSIANGVPSLSRASLVTASWMCAFLRGAGDEDLRAMARAILGPRLVESLSYDKDVEGRVIASFSLLNLTKNSEECVSMVSTLDKDELVKNLKHLRLVTWTANKLLSIIT